MEFICENCLHEFTENEAVIIEFGTGAVLSKDEVYTCPKCESTRISEKKKKLTTLDEATEHV